MSEYEFSESLGAHHPVEVSLTVAQATERERGGLPLPIGGDPETDLSRELLMNRRARRSEDQGAPAPDSFRRLVSRPHVGHGVNRPGSRS